MYFFQSNYPCRHQQVLSLSRHHIVWRASTTSEDGSPLRPVTWDIQIGKNLSLRADLDREGEMRDVDFREVRGNLNLILASAADCRSWVDLHRDRLKQSLRWQRNSPPSPEPQDGDEHMLPCEFEKDSGCWRWAVERPSHNKESRLRAGPVLRPASNQMLLERREERQLALHWETIARWRAHMPHDLDVDVFKDDVCRWRIFNYWKSLEFRQLFASAPQFVGALCVPGVFPELDDTGDAAWLETVTRLARLPRRELMARLGLPSTRQAVRLFSRIQAHLVIRHLPLIREALTSPLSLKRLSDTTCSIDASMLRMSQIPRMPVRWALYRALCRQGPHTPQLVTDVEWELDYFGDNKFSRYLQNQFRRARSVEDLDRIRRFARWFRLHWDGLLQPGVEETLAHLQPPLPEREDIQLLNKPLTLIETAVSRNLCLGEYLLPVSRGEYALYEVNYQNEFAVAGLCRSADGRWSIDQIRGHNNAESSVKLSAFVEEWMNREMISSPNDTEQGAISMPGSLRERPMNRSHNAATR